MRWKTKKARSSATGHGSAVKSEGESDPAQSIVAGRLPDGDLVRVSFTKYAGKDFVDVRVFFPTTDSSSHGMREGIAIKLSHLPMLRQLLEGAERVARTLDML